MKYTINKKIKTRLVSTRLVSLFNPVSNHVLTLYPNLCLYLYNILYTIHLVGLVSTHGADHESNNVYSCIKSRIRASTQPHISLPTGMTSGR